MERIKIDRFDKGINESLESDRIPDNAVVSGINMEYSNSDTPERRKGIDLFADSENWKFDGVKLIPAKFYVWYAPVMPSRATGEIVYFIFTTSNRLFISYEKGSWNTEEITITDVDYTDVTADELVFTNAGDKIVIVDNVNKSHFVMFDKDGELVSGVLEYPAPQNKITFNPMTEWDNSRFETTITEAYLGDCGMYQYIYAYADRFGNLSNPSPISDTYYIDYFEYDDNGDDDRKVDRIQLYNMALPDGLDKNTKDNIEEFYIYRRNVRYSEGVDVGAFELIKVIKIGKKPVSENDPNNNSVNSWTDIEFVTEGDIPSYGNIAPVAVDAIATSGVLIDIGAKTKDILLWDFKYKCPINLPNSNATNYINGGIILELHKDYLVDKDGNKPFVPNDYIDYGAGGTGSGKIMVNREKLIFFDSDLTTPLNTVAFDYDADKIRVIVAIPQLSSGEKSIYFCFTPEADFDDYSGIPDKYMEINSGIDYGAFHIAGYHNFDTQRTLVGEKVESSRSVICTDFEFLKDDDVVNKSNLDFNGSIADNSPVSKIATVPFLESYGGYYNANPSFTIGNIARNTSVLFYDSEIINDSIPAKGFIKYRIYNDFPSPKTFDSDYYRVFTFYNDDDNRFAFGLIKIGVEWEWGTIYNDGISIITNSTGIIADYGNDQTRFLCFSWDRDENIVSISINRSNSANPTYEYLSEEISIQSIVLSLNTLRFGTGGKIDQLQFILDTYLSADNELHNNNVISMSNFMPYFEQELIGYDFVNETYNNNITFEEVEEIKYNNTNRVMWTPVNGLSFNIKDYKDVSEQCKRGIVAPYFLQDTYGNSAIIFTRNKIIRFLLDGTPDKWSLRTDNFITEYTQYGLLSKNSLGRFGESLFWHSEIGFMRWDRNGIQLISKNRLDVPIKDSIVGFPVPLRNQYMFHDNTANKSWVYHIDTDVWTIFNGLDLDQVQILSGGTDDNNYNLFLTSDNIVNFYPTTGSTDESTEIKTKAYPFDNIDFYRFRIDFDGDCDVSTIVKNPDRSLVQSFTNIDRMEWNYLNNGSWGENLQFIIDNVDKLKKIEFDINRR